MCEGHNLHPEKHIQARKSKRRAGGWTDPQCILAQLLFDKGGVAPPSDGLLARGWLRLRQRLKALIWARAFYGPSGGSGVPQLPAVCAWRTLPSRWEGARQPDDEGPGGRASVGARKHLQVWRRPCQGDHIWRECWRDECNEPCSARCLRGCSVQQSLRAALPLDHLLAPTSTPRIIQEN